MRVGPWGQHTPKVQPGINVGVQSIPQLGSIQYTSGIITDSVQASAYFVIHTEMDVIEEAPTQYTHLDLPNVPAGEEIYRSGANIPNQNAATFAGLNLV